MKTPITTFDSLAKLKLGSAIVEKCGAIYIPEYRKPPPDLEMGDYLKNIKEELLCLDWVTKRTARHEYFMSLEKRTYIYGKGTGSESYDSKPFSPLVYNLMEWVNSDLQTEFNVCFLNKYDDQHQHLGWHADDFHGMRADQPIVVMSFGVVREIWAKDKRGYTCFVCLGSGHIRDLRCTSCQGSGFLEKLLPNQQHPIIQRFPLEEASLFIMPPGYQDTHLHRIPKHDRPCGWRISLTFRSFK